MNRDKENTFVLCNHVFLQRFFLAEGNATFFANLWKIDANDVELLYLHVTNENFFSAK